MRPTTALADMEAIGADTGTGTTAIASTEVDATAEGMMPGTRATHVEKEATSKIVAAVEASNKAKEERNYPPVPAEKDSGPLKRIRIASVQGQPPTAAEEARASERGDPSEAAKRKRAERFGIPYSPPRVRLPPGVRLG